MAPAPPVGQKQKAAAAFAEGHLAYQKVHPSARLQACWHPPWGHWHPCLDAAAAVAILYLAGWGGMHQAASAWALPPLAGLQRQAVVAWVPIRSVGQKHQAGPAGAPGLRGRLGAGGAAVVVTVLCCCLDSLGEEGAAVVVMVLCCCLDSLVEEGAAVVVTVLRCCLDSLVEERAAVVVTVLCCCLDNLVEERAAVVVTVLCCCLDSFGEEEAAAAWEECLPAVQ